MFKDFFFPSWGLYYRMASLRHRVNVIVAYFFLFVFVFFFFINIGKDIGGDCRGKRLTGEGVAFSNNTCARGD